MFNHLGERPFRHPLLFFIFPAVVYFYFVVLAYIMFQIDMRNNSPLPITFYKFLFLIFLSYLNFPFYNYVSKRYFVVLFVTRKNYIYEKFFKNKEKSWLALSQRKSALYMEFSSQANIACKNNIIKSYLFFNIFLLFQIILILFQD